LPQKNKFIKKKNIVEQLGFSELEINQETNLNPKYTFEDFIVGPFNEIAYAAAIAVTEEPGKIITLFCLWGSGIGKNTPNSSYRK